MHDHVPSVGLCGPRMVLSPHAGLRKGRLSAVCTLHKPGRRPWVIRRAQPNPITAARRPHDHGRVAPQAIVPRTFRSCQRLCKFDSY